MSKKNKKGNKNVGFEFIKAAGAVLGGVGGAAGGIAITTACDLSGFAKYAVVIGTTLGGTAGGYALGYGITYLVSRNADEEEPTLIATQPDGKQRALTEAEYASVMAYLAQTNPDALSALKLVPQQCSGNARQQPQQSAGGNQDLEDQLDDLREQLADLMVMMQQQGQQGGNSGNGNTTGGKKNGQQQKPPQLVLSPEGLALKAKIDGFRRQKLSDDAIVSYLATNSKYKDEVTALKALYNGHQKPGSLIIKNLLNSFYVVQNP